MKLTIDLKPARGFEKIITNYTYSQFIEVLKAQASALGLRYKIQRSYKNIARSDDWGKK